MEMVSERMEQEFMLPDMESTFRVFAAHLRKVDRDWIYSSHKHSLFEVNLVLSGTQEMIVNGEVYVQQPGDLMLLGPGDQHESRAAAGEGMTYYCLHFDVDERDFRELLCRNQQNFYNADSELAEVIRPALDKLIALTTQPSALRIESRMLALSALFELFGGISSTLSKQKQNAAPSRMSVTASEIAARLERAVDETADPGREGGDMETIEAVAAAVGYSMSAVNRMFTRVFGISPRQYMSALMLKKSKLLLMNPEYTIDTISTRLGYKNIAHFSRQFKRWTGESPSHFRGRLHQ